MKELNIGQEGENAEDLALYLEQVIGSIREGNLSGEGWEISEVYDE